MVPPCPYGAVTGSAGGALMDDAGGAAMDGRGEKIFSPLPFVRPLTIRIVHTVDRPSRPCGWPFISSNAIDHPYRSYD